MQLLGIIERSLGGFATIRGYAKLKDIAKISKVEEFQRKLIKSHTEDIKVFYEKNEALFFPEVILSYTLDYTYETGTSGLDPLQNIFDKKRFDSNIDKISFKPLAGKHNLVRITINDKWLKDNRPFSIIDGNHRINAYVDENEHKSTAEYSAPFSLLLFSKSIDTQKYKKIIFHNINSKAIKLTFEEELKGTIESVDFLDEDLVEDFGIEYLQARKLGNEYSNDQLTTILQNLKNSFFIGDDLNKNTILLKLIEFLTVNKLIDDREIEKIKNSLTKINSEFYNFDYLSKATNTTFFISAVGVELNEELDLKSFLKWLEKNHLSKLDEIQPQSLYDIYIKINEHNPKVFVAMPYFSKDEVENYNDIYKRIIDKINSENRNLMLELLPIMSNVGRTEDIVNKMLKQIDDCFIFIADISEGNPNVAYELGYAKSKDKPTIIVRRKRKDEENVPFDFSHDVRIDYNPMALKTLEDQIYTNITAILNEKGLV